MTEVKSNGSAQTNAEPNVDNSGTKALKGFILWGIVLAGYLLFCFNWMVMDNMKGVAGESGWYGSFFGTGYDIPGIVEQAPNWTLTFMRGVGAFLAGWLLVKIGHKYSVTIAISLLAFGGILGPLTGLMTSPAAGEANYAGFVLFLVLRMIMAVGATTLIVYTQPVIANYFNEGQKSTANLFNAIAFNVGSILAIGLLTYGLKDTLVSHWILFTSSVSLIAIVLLILWLVLAEPIAQPNDPNDTATYGSVLKEKRTWMYAIMFGLWLTWVVLYLTMVPGHFLTPISSASGHTFESWYVGTWKILFLAGLFGGIPLYNWIATKNFSRRVVAMSTLVIGVALTLVTALIGGYWLDASANTTFALILFFTTSFFAGVAGWGIQGYMLGTTYHYKGATPKKQGVLLGACWGIGYMGETVITILLSETNNWVFFALFLFASLMTAVMWLLIDETHGKNPHPDSLHA